MLAQASLVPTYSRSCSALYSCRVGRNVIINVDRWRSGARAFPGSLAQYRQMVLNHETGHWLGLGHASCPGRGRPAPVMQQQSKGMQGCTPNAWPLDRMESLLTTLVNLDRVVKEAGFEEMSL